MEAKDILNVTPDQVIQVYRGRPGCDCGCCGKYTNNMSVIVRTLDFLKENSNEVKFTPFKDDVLGVKFGCFSIERENRYRWIYV